MAGSDERLRSRRSRSGRRHRSPERGRRRSRTTSRSPDRSARGRSYSRSSSHDRTSRSSRPSSHRNARRSSRSPSRSTRGRRRSRSRSASYSRSRRSRSPSYSLSRRSVSPRRDRRRSPSPVRDSAAKHSDRSESRSDAPRPARPTDHGFAPQTRGSAADPPDRKTEVFQRVVEQDEETKMDEESSDSEEKSEGRPPYEQVKRVAEKSPTTTEQVNRNGMSAKREQMQATLTAASVEPSPASTPLPQPKAAGVAIQEDPAVARRREKRQEAHRAFLKSTVENAKARSKLLSMEADLQLAETWLQYTSKNLEDVGRRIELQDWKFKKLEEGTDLTELLEPPSVDQPEPECQASQEAATA